MRRDDAGRASWLACMVCLVVGALARVWGFLTAGPLWLDELFIAGNLLELPLAELFGPLQYGQNAPIGWLVLHKAFVSLFGDSEAVLRFPSLVASLATLPIVWWVGVRVVGRSLAFLPLFVVSFSPYVLWQGLQVKQYSFDLLVAVMLLALAVRALDDSRGLGVLAGVGFLGLWMSQPAVFVLAGIGLVLLVDATHTGDRRRRGLVTATGVLWVLTFGLNYLLFLRPAEQPEWLYRYWAPGFFPWPPEGWEAVLWLPRVIGAALEDPTGFLDWGAVALVPLLIGLVLLVRTDERIDRRLLWLIAAPAATTLAAAFLGLYPFRSRLVLFLVPSLMMLFAAGVRLLITTLPRARGLVVTAAALLLGVPFGLFLIWLPTGGLPIAADTPALFDRLKQARGPDRKVLVEHLANYAWRYYGRGSDLDVEFLGEGWNAQGRTRRLRKALQELEDDEVVVGIIRTTPRPEIGLWASVASDVRQGDLRSGASYLWLVGRMTPWPALEKFEAAVPERWEITGRNLVHGGCVWTLQRVN